MPEDELIPIVSFDSNEITFDSCLYTWDSCHHQKKTEIIKNALKISGGMAMVLEHGENGRLYSRIDTFEDTSLSITLTNPMFNDVGSHSVPFSIPPSAQNLRIFGFPHRPERYTEIKQLQYPMYIFAEGLQILYGMLVVTSADPSGIECYFKSGNGDFHSSIKGKSLKDINLGESQTFATETDAMAYINNSVVKSYPEVPFAMFPMVNPGMNKDLTWDEVNSAGIQSWLGVVMVNYWDPQAHRFLNEWTSLSPFLYLNFVLDKLMATFGYTSELELLQQYPELKKLVLHNNFSRFWTDNPAFSFPLSGGCPTKFEYSHYVQDYPIADFVQELGKLFCATLFVNDRNKTAKLIAFKDVLLKHPAIQIGKVVSDIRVSETEPFDSFAFTFENDDKAYHEDDIKTLTGDNTVLAPVFDTLPPLSSVNTLVLVTSEDMYYYIKHNPSSLPYIYWEKYSRNIKKNHGTPLNTPLEISSELWTLPMFYGTDTLFNQAGPTSYYLVSWPLANQRLFFDFSNEADPPTDKYTPRLLFYRGLQSGTPGPGGISPQYPLGTFDVYNATKAYGQNFPIAKIPDANIALQWDGEYGLIENFYKEYMQWKMAGPEKLEFEEWFDVTELAALDFSRRYAINNTHMFLDSVAFSINSKGVTVSKVTAFKI